MSEETKNDKNTLSLGEESTKCLSETTPETYSVITWAINMTPNPTVESIYKICSTAEELNHLNQQQIKATIIKALEHGKVGKK